MEDGNLLVPKTNVQIWLDAGTQPMSSVIKPNFFISLDIIYLYRLFPANFPLIGKKCPPPSSRFIFYTLSCPKGKKDILIFHKHFSQISPMWITTLLQTKSSVHLWASCYAQNVRWEETCKPVGVYPRRMWWAALKERKTGSWSC